MHRTMITPAEVEKKVKEMYPNLTAPENRLGLLMGPTHTHGKALRHNVLLPPELWLTQGNLYLIPSQPLGATETQCEIALQACQDVMRQTLNRNQIKLLLKGDAALERRVVKLQGLPSGIKDVMTAAAKRYRMCVKNEDQLDKKPVVSQQVGPGIKAASAKQPEQTAEWSTVVRRGKKQKEESTQKTARSTSDYELFAEDWSQPLMKFLKLATPGVILAGQQEEAQRMAKMLKGTKHPVAIISIEPLPHSVQSEHIVFRAQQVVQRGQQQVRHEKILQGYLANFGPQLARPLLKVATVSCPQKQLTSTSVILLSSRRSVVTAETWQQIRKYSTLRDVKTGLQSVPGAPQRIVDLFNLQCTNERRHTSMAMPGGTICSSPHW